MNVLEISNYSAPYAGNFMLSLLDLESRLDDGIMVYLFPMETKNIYYVSEMKHVFYLTGNLIHDTILIRNIIAKYKISVIHSHFSSSEQNFAILLSIVFNSKIRYIKHEHGEIRETSGLRKTIRQFLRYNVDIFIPCNHPIFEQLVHDGVPKEKIFTVTNAVDFSRLDIFEQSKKDDTIQILMFGSDWYRKGGDIAIKAVGMMKNVRLNIALSSGLEAVKENIIRDFGEIPEYVNFLPPRNDVATYYHMADVFISPSRSEGLPYSIIEAMYCETFIVVSDILPQQNIVSEEFMFKSENYKELALKIQSVLQIEEKEIIKREFRETAINNYNLQSWSEKILSIYKA